MNENYFKGMAEAIKNDPIVASLFIGSLAVWRQKSLAAAVSTFFLGYAAMGEVTNLALTINGSAKGLSRALVTRQSMTNIQRQASSPQG
jgi:hypothetical protein